MDLGMALATAALPSFAASAVEFCGVTPPAVLTKAISFCGRG